MARSGRSGRVSVGLFDGGGSDCYLESTEDIFVQEQWVQVAVRYHSGANTVEVRVKDRLVGMASCSTRLADLELSHVYLGKAAAAYASAQNLTDVGPQEAYLNADVAGIFIQSAYLTRNDIALLVEKFEGPRVDGSQFLVGQALPEALLAALDLGSSVIPTSKIHVTVMLQSQSTAGACDARASWETLDNLEGTTRLGAQAGRVVFTDLRVNGAARPCLRLLFSTGQNVTTWTKPFAVFPRLSMAPSASNTVARLAARQGYMMDALEIRSPGAPGFKVVAQLQTCAPQCRTQVGKGNATRCRAWVQEGFAPSMSTRSSRLLPDAQTVALLEDRGRVGFLQVRAAAIILSEIEQEHSFPLKPVDFRVKLAFNVDVDSHTVITLSGLKCASKSASDVTVFGEDSGGTSDWIVKADWRQAGGEMELHLAQGVTLAAGHVMSFGFSLTNDGVPRPATEVVVAATNFRAVVMRSPRPMAVLPPRFDAKAEVSSTWPGSKNAVNVSLSATFDLQAGSLLTLSGLHIGASCEEIPVTSSCGEYVGRQAGAAEDNLTQVVIFFSETLPAGSSCFIAIAFVNSEQAQPERELLLSFVGQHFNVSQQAAITGAPLMVEEPGFILAQYGLTSRGSLSTITATLVSNTELSGHDAGQDIFFRISSPGSAPSFMVEVGVVPSSEYCAHDDERADEAWLVACLSNPSCMRNSTCSLELLRDDQCRNSTVPTALLPTCKAMAMQQAHGGSEAMTHSFHLRGRLPAGVELVLRWGASVAGDPRLNLTCSRFGERVFVLTDALRELFGSSLTSSRLPDFLAARSSQTSSWPGAVNHILVTLVPGHTIPLGSLLTVSGFPFGSIANDSVASVVELAGLLVWVDVSLADPTTGHHNATMLNVSGITTVGNVSGITGFVLRAQADIQRGGSEVKQVVHSVVAAEPRVWDLESEGVVCA